MPSAPSVPQCALGDLLKNASVTHCALVAPSAHSPPVRSAQRDAKLTAARELPEELQGLFRAWSAVCEELCTRVTAEFKSLTSPQPTRTSPSKAHHQATVNLH